MNRRVVITGAGTVSALGVGMDTFMDRLMKGESGIRRITAFDTEAFGSHLAAPIDGFNPKDIIDPKNLRKMDTLSRAAVAATKLAANDARLVIDDTSRDRTGIVLGTALGATEISILFAHTLFTDGPMMINPLHVPNTVMNAAAGHASIELGFRGINSTINHKESSAEAAMVYAADQIVKGRADAMFAGGADVMSPLLFEALTRFRALSPTGRGKEGARPYDKGRNGAVIGEGAGVICLESLDNAKKRGAPIYGEITGWGMSASCAPPTDFPTDPRGYILAINRALDMARIAPKDIGCIFGAANGGKKLDALEAGVFMSVFGDDSSAPHICSIKGAIGEPFGGGGGLRAATLAASIKNGIIPPTTGLTKPDLPLNYTMKPITEAIGYALLCGVSSGGTYVCLVFSRYEA